MSEGFTAETSLGQYRIVTKTNEDGTGKVSRACDEPLDAANALLPQAVSGRV